MKPVGMDRHEPLPGLLLPGDLPIVVHERASMVHGGFGSAADPEVGPQGGSKETDAVESWSSSKLMIKMVPDYASRALCSPHQRLAGMR